MPKDSPLMRLRRIRDMKTQLARLQPERDRLIVEALDQGASERQVALAAGLSKSRIHEIRTATGR